MSAIFIDQMGHGIALDRAPERIVSLVPSQTEFLFDLGLDKEIVGVTSFCIHPFEKCKATPKVGGTKTFKCDVIDRLAPDLIIGNKEENTAAGIDRLKERYRVWMSDITTLEDAYQMMARVAEMVGKASTAQAMIAECRERFAQLATFTPIRVAYLMWKNPYMAVGSHTFIHAMLGAAGFENVFAERTRYPEISLDAIREATPDCIFLASEPYPFKDSDARELQSVFPKTKILLVDGELFSWYGSRLLKAPAYFEKLRHLLT